MQQTTRIPALWGCTVGSMWVSGCAINQSFDATKLEYSLVPFPSPNIGSVQSLENIPHDMTDLYEATFKWPAGPSKVIVTGSFDNWSHATELSKGHDGFTGTFHLPWDAKVTYKYVVDGQWRTNPAEPQEPDEAGNINNVYTTPRKPAVIPQEHKEYSPVAPAPAVVAPRAPVAEKTSMEGAKDTAASVVSYMASGFGAAFASVTGIDPINPQQIPLEDDKAKEVLETIPVPAPDAKKAEPAPTVGTAHDPLVPEAPIAAKPISDALAPIADEPVVLNLLPAAASTNTNTTSSQPAGLDLLPAASVTEQATATSKFAAATSYIPSTAQISAAVASTVAAVTDKLPSTSAVVDKVQETVAPATSVPIPDAPEPYKEAPTSSPIPVPDAPEPYKVTANGTLPGELEAAPKKVEETVEKVKEETAASGAVPAKATETVEKVKDTVKGATDTAKGTIKSIGKRTPPASPTKKAFPSSDTAGSITSSSAPGDGSMSTPKRKKRQSIFGKLKEALTPDKKKKERLGSTSS